MANVTTPNPSLVGHEQRITGLETDVCRHETFINGNGAAGAKTDIIELKTAVADIKKAIDRMSMLLWGLILSIAGSVIIWLLTEVLPTYLKGNP